MPDETTQVSKPQATKAPAADAPTPSEKGKVATDTRGRSVTYVGPSSLITNSFGLWKKGEARRDLTDEQIAQLGPGFKVGGKAWPGDIDLQQYAKVR